MLSATIHALFAAAMFLVAYAFKDEVTKPAKTFELVQGPGDNYAATEAPALGTPEGTKVEMPNLAPLPLPPAPTPPTPEPIVQAPPETSPVEAVPPPKETPLPVPPKIPPKPKPEPSPVTKAEPKKPDPVVPDLSRTIKRTQSRMAAKQKAQRDKEAKAAAAALAAATKQAELARLKAAQAGGGQSGIKKIDAKGIAQGVVGGSVNNNKSGANGTALSREEVDLLDAYKKLLAVRLRESHDQVKPTGLSDNLKATVEIFLAADGSLLRPKIVKSSGSAEFDASVISAIRNTNSIGKRPDSQGGLFELNFYMKDSE